MFEDLIDFAPHFQYILQGTLVTLQYSFVSVLFGALIGTVLAIFKVSNNLFLRIFAISYTSVFRGTPLFVQMTIIYFGFPNLGVHLGVFEAAVISLSLNSGAYVSEVIRSGINHVDKGQVEAAKALGISPILRMKDIILPQAIRNILPALANEFINLIKESSLVSVIGGVDLMKRAQMVSSETYSYFMPMLTVAFAYYILVMVISIFAKILEKRLAL